MSKENKFDLDKDEQIKLIIPRHKIGIILIWLSEVLGAVILTAVLIWLNNSASHNFLPLDSDVRKYITATVFILYAVLFISGLVGTIVYRGNAMVVTNKRVIHRATNALFATQVKMIDLDSVEDVSSKKTDPLQQVFNYGTLHMSTDSDETTYQFTFVANPTTQVKTISRIIREYKEAHTKKAKK